MTSTTEPSSSLSEAEQFLKTLDLPNDESSNAGTATGDEPSGSGQAANASDIMSFLDEIANTTSNYDAAETGVPPPSQSEPKTIISDSWKQWGASIWNQANEAVKSTSEQINQAASNPDTAKAIQSSVKGWQVYLSSDNVAKLGQNRSPYLICIPSYV